MFSRVFHITHSGYDSMHILSEIRFDEDIAKLNQMAESRNNQDRLEALRRLSFIGDKSSGAVALKSLKYRNSEVREYAIYILGQIQEERAVPYLINIASNDHTIIRETDYFERKVTISDSAKDALFLQMEYLPSEYFIPLLVNPKVSYKALAIEALGKAKSKKHLKTINTYYDSKYYELRRAAVAAIGHLSKHDISLSSYLYAALEDESDVVKVEAIKHLCKKCVQDNLDKIIYLLNSNRDLFVLFYAIKSLEGIKEKRVIHALIKRLDDPLWQVRNEAANILTNIQDPDIYNEFLKRVNSNDTDIRVYALIGLSRYKSNRAHRYALELYHSNDTEKKYYGIVALGNQSNPATLDMLIADYYAENDWSKRSPILEAISKYKNKKAAAILTKEVKSKSDYYNDWKDKINAAKGLVINYKKEAIVHLDPLITHKDYRVRAAIVNILKNIGGKDIAPQLIEMLRDSNHEVREQVAKALGDIQSPVAVAPLIHSLNDAYPPSRRAAASSLQIITGKAFGESVKSWLKWWEENKHKYEHLEDSSAPDVGTKAPAAAPAE